MNLYTDGSTPATIDDLRTALAAAEKLEAFAESTAVADVQAHIDADPKLAVLTVAEDQIDPKWVEVTFPTDAGTPLFWAGACGQFAKAGYPISTYTCRVSAARCIEPFDNGPGQEIEPPLLDQLSAML